MGISGTKNDMCVHPNIYRPQRSCGQGNIFTPVCHSVHRGEGVCLSACWDTTPPPPGADPWEQTPPRTDHPPRPDTPPEQNPHPPGADPPDQTPPRSRHPPPGSRLQHTVYERPVRILLECILVFF